MTPPGPGRHTVLRAAARVFGQSHPSLGQRRQPASMRCWHPVSTHDCAHAAHVHTHAAHADSQETSGSRRNRETCADAPPPRAADSCRDDPSTPPHPRRPDNPLICRRWRHPPRAAASWPTAHSAAVCHASGLPPNTWQHQSAPSRRGSMFGGIAAAAARMRPR